MARLLYDCSDDTKRERGIASALRAFKRGALVVMPTDTVYGIAADAFSPKGVQALLTTKGRGRDMPVPVLVASPEALAGVAVTNDAADALVKAFWPGGLTVICQQQPSLQWDIGDAGGTVAVRMPQHDVTLEVLAKAGPLAVSSANISGQPPAETARDARDQLGDDVAVYLEGGPSAGSVPSTIVDVSGDSPRVLRSGAITLDQLKEVLPDIIEHQNGHPAENSESETEGPSAEAEDASADSAEGDVESVGAAEGASVRGEKTGKDE